MRPVALMVAWSATWAWARSVAALAGSTPTRVFSWELRLMVS